jgi:hypothetical protein
MHRFLLRRKHFGSVMRWGCTLGNKTFDTDVQSSAIRTGLAAPAFVEERQDGLRVQLQMTGVKGLVEPLFWGLTKPCKIR